MWVRLWVTLLLLSAPGLMAPGLSGAGLLPRNEDLLTTESKHFRFIFQESLKARVPALMQDFEDAYTGLNPVFNWVPREKVMVLFSDALDNHNGWATVYPHPTILIYAADAQPGSTIYEPGDYLRRTIFHEYAHILSLDSQYGVDNVLTNIFGHVLPVAGDPLSALLALFSASPGTLAPDWYQEGLATWIETEFVGPGRGRNSLVDMIMRMAVNENRLLSPTQWNSRYPEWPYGSVVYFYGLKTMQHAQEQYGPGQPGEPERNIPGELSDSLSHSIAFSFNRRAKPIVKKKFSHLAHDAMTAERKRQRTQIEQLETRPLTPIQRLTQRGLLVSEPTFGPEGQTIYFSGGPQAARASLYRYDRRTGQTAKLSAARTHVTLTGITPSPDRQALFYTRLDVTGNDRLWNELYRYGIRDDRHTVVTYKGRYRYPTIHPNGTAMAAVRVAAGLQHLMEVPLAQAGDVMAERHYVRAEPERTIIDPVYSPDGRSLLYISADENGSTLRQIELENGTDQAILHGQGIIMSPTFHPSGDYLVFSGNQNGVYNLYRLPFPAGPTATAEPITHVLGGLFSPDFSPDGAHLAAVGYDSHGYFLTVLDTAALQPLGHPLPVIRADWQALSAHQHPTPSSESVPPAGEQELALRPYHSLSGFGFDFWSPWLTASSESISGGIAASFSDPTQDQQLFGLVGGESEFGTPVGLAAYRYSGWNPAITLYGRYLVQSYNDLVLDNQNHFFDYDETVGEVGIAATYHRLRADWRSQFTLGYQYTHRQVIEASADDYAGRVLRTDNLFEGNESALWAQVVFANFTTFPRSHSPEDGRYLAAVVEGSTDVLGSELNRVRLRGDGAEYISLPWANYHVLKLEVTAGAGVGDETAQGSFGLGGLGGLLFNTGFGLSRNVSLRGYTSNEQVGDYVIKAGIAYRFPVFALYRGVSTTLPFYLQQSFIEVFYEGGTAWDDDGPNETKWLNSMGVEFNMSMTLFRFIDVAPGLGVAYAPDRDPRRFDPDDDVQVYLTIKGAINF